MQRFKTVAVRRSVDNLIKRYGNEHPDLLRELLELREQLDEKTKMSVIERSVVALRIVSLVQWFFDHLPPPD